MKPASLIFEGLVGALDHFRDRRLPELFCGLSDAGGSKVLTIRNPSLPPSVRRLEIDRLRVGPCLGFRREETRFHIYRVDVTGGELRTEIALDYRE